MTSPREMVSTAPRLRILVVAGEPDDAALAVRVLEDNGDHAARSGDVPEALSRVAQEHFDLAFVSLSMPRGDGLALVHHLSALYPDIDVVAMAGADDLDEAGSAMALGVLATVVTPLTGDDVLVAADRARERRILIQERAGLHAKVVNSTRLAETYRRCADFVAETEPTRIAAGVLAECEAELSPRAAAVYLPASAGKRLVKQASGELSGGMPEVIEGELYDQLRGAPDTFSREGKLHLPLRSGDRLLGAVLLEPSGGPGVDEEAVGVLRAVVPLASAALSHSGRVHAVSKGGIRDADTGAYTFAYFGDVAARELERAGRYHRAFALLTLEFAGMEAMQAQLSELEVARTWRLLTQAVLSSVRVSDVVARRDEQGFYLLLPETGLLGALVCRRRILETMGKLTVGSGVDASWLRPIFERSPLEASSGISVFPSDGSALGELLKLSRRRAERARGGVWKRRGLHRMEFWPAFDALLDQDGDDFEASGGLSSRAVMPLPLVAKIAEGLIRDAARDGVAGSLYLAGDAELSSTVVRAAASSHRLPLRTWILGPSRTVRDPVAQFRLPLTDSRLNKAYLILCVSERGGYCLLARAGVSGDLEAFHSSDLDIVEGLVSALQGAYHLQPELR